MSHKRIPTILHSKLSAREGHITPQILDVPNYNGILMVRKKNRVQNDVYNKICVYDYIGNFKHFIEQNHISAIHAHHGSLGIKLLHIKKEFDLPFITSFRGKDVTENPGSKAYKKRLKQLFEWGDLFLPVCEFLAGRIRDLGCPKEKIQVLYGGINLHHFPYTPREYMNHQPIRLLAVGRFVEKKGFHYLIPAFAKIHKKYPNSELLLVGRGGMEKEYKKKIASLGLKNHVQIKNWVDYRKILSLYEKSHIFCAPSCTGIYGNTEGIPNTLKEAMATGMPVVATKHAGTPELVTHQKSGLLVREKNVDELAEAIGWFLDNPNKWGYFGKNARNKVERNFDINKQIKVQKQYYDELFKKWEEGHK